MRPSTFRDLAAAAGATDLHGNVDILIQQVDYDSRRINPGGLFVALRGGYADGHSYLNDARDRGAVAALVESPEHADGFEAWAQVEDTRRALSPLAARFFDYPGNDLGIVGITGTDGKTTTSYLVDAMLRTNGYRTGAVGTVSIRIGDELILHYTRQTTPESLEVQHLLHEMRDAGTDWTVIEATSHGLAMYRLDDCPFDIAVVTNVTREHLDFHGSVDAYRVAKAKLLQFANDRGGRRFPAGAVINADDDGARAIAHAAGNLPVVWFSLEDPTARLFADNIASHEQGTRFCLTLGRNKVDVELRLLGTYNVMNALAAAGVGDLIGLTPDEIRIGLESLENVPGRLERVRCGQPFSVVVDYAHSPASLEETLRLLRNVTPGRLFSITGSAGERDRGKRPLQGRLSAELADVSIFTSEDPRFEDPDAIIDEIAAGARMIGARPNVDYYCIEDRRHAIEKALEMAREGDMVVLAGKGHEQCMIYGDQRVPWSDVAEAERALHRLGYAEHCPETEGSV